MRKTTFACLALAAALTFAACGGSAQKPETTAAATTQAPTTAAASTQAASTEAETTPEGGQVLKPTQQDPEIGSSMKDNAYLVTIDPNSFKKSGDGYEVKAEFYSFDRFKKKEVEALKAGDVIRLHSGDIKVETVNVNKGDQATTVEINGGYENGGCDLLSESKNYRTMTTDDFPDYYSLGSAVLPVSADCVYMDFSDSSNPQGTTYAADKISGAFKKEKDLNWGPQAISIQVEGGKVTQIFRIFTP